MRSGQRVEIVFGVISPKIKRSKVATRVAIPTPLGPKVSRAIDVIIEERKMFTMSLETRSELIRRSLWSKRRPAMRARLSLFFLRILSLNLFIPRKELSEMENNMERTIRPTSTRNIQGEGLESILLEVCYSGCKEIFAGSFAFVCKRISAYVLEEVKRSTVAV